MQRAAAGGTAGTACIQRGPCATAMPTNKLAGIGTNAQTHTTTSATTTSA